MMRRVWRRLRRASSVQCALVLLVLLGAWSRAAAYDPVLDPLRDLFAWSVTKFVTRSFRGRLEVEALRGSLLGSMVLQNIMLRDEQGPVAGQIAELRLVYDPKAILYKRLHIQTAEVVRLQLTLAQEPDGSLNILSLLSPAPPENPAAPELPPASQGLAFALAIDSLHIRDGELTLHFPAPPGVQKPEDLQARLSVHLDEEKQRLQVQ